MASSNTKRNTNTEINELYSTPIELLKVKTMLHEPEGWVILKFTSPDDTYFKIFGSWRGGYLHGDSWRLSSGSNSPPTLSDCGKYWIWPQKSGSCYHLSVNEEDGYTFYTDSILSKIISHSGENDVCVERVKLSSLFN